MTGSEQPTNQRPALINIEDDGLGCILVLFVILMLLSCLRCDIRWGDARFRWNVTPADNAANQPANDAAEEVEG